MFVSMSGFALCLKADCLQRWEGMNQPAEHTHLSVLLLIFPSLLPFFLAPLAEEQPYCVYAGLLNRSQPCQGATSAALTSRWRLAKMGGALGASAATAPLLR